MRVSTTVQSAGPACRCWSSRPGRCEHAAAGRELERRRADQRQPPAWRRCRRHRPPNPFALVGEREAQRRAPGAWPHRCRSARPVAAERGHRIGHQRSQRDGRDAGGGSRPTSWRAVPSASPRPASNLVGDGFHHAAGRVHHRVGRGQVQRGELACRGARCRRRARSSGAASIEAEAQAQRRRAPRSEFVRSRMGAAAARRPTAQARQREGFAADEIDGLNGTRLDAPPRRYQLDGEAGREPWAARPLATAQREAWSTAAPPSARTR